MDAVSVKFLIGGYKQACITTCTYTHTHYMYAATVVGGMKVESRIYEYEIVRWCIYVSVLLKSVAHQVV